MENVLLNIIVLTGECWIMEMWRVKQVKLQQMIPIVSSIILSVLANSLSVAANKKWTFRILAQDILAAILILMWMTKLIPPLHTIPTFVIQSDMQAEPRNWARVLRCSPTMYILVFIFLYTRISCENIRKCPHLNKFEQSLYEMLAHI